MGPHARLRGDVATDPIVIITCKRKGEGGSHSQLLFLAIVTGSFL